jgi:hypothetical protein
MVVLASFGPIEGHNWFSRFPANESLRRTGLQNPEAVRHKWEIFKYREVKTGFGRKREMLTGSSDDSHWLEIWKNHSDF